MMGTIQCTPLLAVQPYQNSDPGRAQEKKIMGGVSILGTDGRITAFSGHPFGLAFEEHGGVRLPQQQNCENGAISEL